ncbi:C6 finger domain-containing protein, variant, partial [Dermatophagoides pteronyssinus]
ERASTTTTLSSNTIETTETTNEIPITSTTTVINTNIDMDNKNFEDQIHKSNTSTNSTSMNETENSLSTNVNSLSIPEFILNLTTSSSFVSNCTDVEFYCEILLPSKSIPDNVNNQIIQINSSTIWWTFRDQNVSSSTLPGGRVINRPDNLYLSILNIECAQFGVHDGDYSCHSSSSSSLSSLSSSTEISGSQQQFSIITNSSNLHFEISDGRIEIEHQFLPESSDDLVENQINPLKLFQSILHFETLRRSDNGTYICRAIDIHQKLEKPKTQEFNVIVLEVPEIHIEKIEIENKTTAIISFVIDFDGNLPIEKFILELRNYTNDDDDYDDNHNENLTKWIRLETPSPESILIKHNYSIINVDNLVHAATYGFRLAATNRIVGQSEWSSMNITVPADVPSPINNVHLLSKSNETLLFGWRRPLHDNGAPIIQFHQILKDNNNVIIWNQTINNTQSRNKHMSLFSNLQPGTHYSFQIRACSQIGCGDWSSIFEVITSDGHSDPPKNIHIECFFDEKLIQTNATISWEEPSNPRGLIVGYNISLRGHTTQSQRFFESFEQSYLVNSNQTFLYETILKPNSNYTVRICAINKSGCGQLSPLTSSSMCQSSPTVPSEFPSGIRLERIRLSSSPSLSISTSNSHYSGLTDKETLHQPFIGQQQHNHYQQQQQKQPKPERQLKLYVPRISERNGPFRCIRVIVIRLPSPNSSASSSLSPISSTNISSQSLSYNISNNNNTDQQQQSDIFSHFLDRNGQIPLSTYRMVHSKYNTNTFGAYIAKEFTSESFPNEIILGDGRISRCYNDALEYDLKSRIKHSQHYQQQQQHLKPDEHIGGLDDNRSPRRINYELQTTRQPSNSTQENESKNDEIFELDDEHLVEDLELFPNTYYSASIEVTVMAVNHTLLVEQSPWTKPIRTVPIITMFSQSNNSFSETTTGIIYGTICGLLLIMILFFSILCFLKRKATEATTPVLLDDERIGLSNFLRRTLIGRKHSKDHQTLFYQLNFNSTQAVKKWASKPIPIQNLVAVFQQRRTNSDFLFQAEFESLPESFPDRTTIESDRIENVTKNRYPDIKSYDQTRVVLKKIDDIEGSDYINADFVNGGLVNNKQDKRFICAQGPTQKTVPDFWHFLAPDQPSWLLRFIKRVNEHYCVDRGPIVVHCSAGVGRTGTFIAIDSLISRIDDGAQDINVFECVSSLRYQRNFLVQSLRQYIFVYRAIMEYVEFGDTEIEAGHIRDHYKQLKEQKTESGNGVFTEFEKLSEVFEEPKSCVVGQLETNKHKNRYSFIIPYDINRVILNPSQDTCYINASFIQGYDHTLSFIVAQDPLEHTVNEFWWMIAEHDVSTLVMLAEIGDGQNKCHQYWPQSVDSTFDCDFVKVKLIEEEMFQYYVKRVFHITKKKTNKSHVVNQYQFFSWKSGVVVPESTKSLITLTDAVLLANNPNNNNNNNNNGQENINYSKYNGKFSSSSTSSPILVHCSGGGDRSSVFVSFASLVRQLQLEERVDVFQTARYTKSQRHCMLQTIAQYDFLYRCLIDYMDCHHICNNSDTQL